ncbi:MAG TPA: hypothetical protein VLQ89_03890, partial [Candidatus Binatia bacterium]|nr:hypothetical protein [Candidatus Binatia bacterium]
MAPAVTMNLLFEISSAGQARLKAAIKHASRNSDLKLFFVVIFIFLRFAIRWFFQRSARPVGRRH